MFKPVPVAIGLRYLRAKRRNGFISFISLASILGIALGVTALITTLAVMSGFQREIRDRMLQMAAHATISADGVPMQDWQQADAGTRDQALLQGLALSRARQWLLDHPASLSAAERGYIEASVAQASRQKTATLRSNIEG